MIKQKHLNRWLWRWHLMAGLMTLPVMLFLSISGIIYLFKNDVNQWIYNDTLHVNVSPHTVRKTYQQQMSAVQSYTDHAVAQVVLPQANNEATRFNLHGGRHGRNSVYVDPYTGGVTGQIDRNQTLMYDVRKFHGELLLGTPGTLVVELVASWFLVLILTGIYIWWPTKKLSAAGFFTIRTNKGARLFWRDMHSVLGFWLSIFMLLILAGGMPWTDVFGSNLRWVQEQTNTGYPEHWTNSKGLHSKEEGLKSLDLKAGHVKGGSSTTARQQEPKQSPIGYSPLTLDEMVLVAKQQGLLGQITLKLPKDDQGVFTVSNRSKWLRDQQVLHFDQYSAEVVEGLSWSNVGILMAARQVAMRLHQGEYGLANWLAVLLVTLLFTLSVIAGLISYLLRKPKGQWGFPNVPKHFNVGRVVVAGIFALAVLFPMFGLSLLAMGIWQCVVGYFSPEKATA